MDRRARSFSSGAHAVTDVALATGAGVIAALLCCYPIYGVADAAKGSLKFKCVPLQQQEKMSVH